MKVCTACQQTQSLDQYYSAGRGIYKSQCKECLRDKARKRGKLRDRSLVYARNKNERKNLKREVMAHYGGKCVCCGVGELDFLCLDHINNDGKRQRAIGLGGGVKFYRYVRRHWPEDLQILCANCNLSKQLSGNCLHQELVEGKIGYRTINVQALQDTE